jgi:uncharacterized damage-inducible protein DinB
MSREYFAKKWEDEQPAFGRVLRALPADQLAYKPHERSSSAGDIAWQLVEEQRQLALMIETGEMRWEPRPRPATLDEIVAAWDTATADLRKLIARIDDAKWGGPTSYILDGAVFHTSTIEDSLWGFLLDMVHHRGQLSAYIRPMGGKVPSIYGPSADDQG